jgi:ADP-dependent NAD(P)H-hydrate dehydratase
MGSKKKKENVSRRQRVEELPPRLISSRLLRRWPLPQPDADGDKEGRGRVLVIGGSPEMPGAAILAATAALRAGAGKLQIATCRSVAQAIAVAVPEARVFALPETQSGAIDAKGIRQIEEYIGKARGVLVGPGLCDEEAIARLVKSMLTHVASGTLVLDANALNVLEDSPKCLHGLQGRVILTPHAEEMSEMTGLSEEEIESDRVGTLRRAVEDYQAVVVLKGRETLIGAPHVEQHYCNRAGNVGLATSGSGDTLAGLITGLAARGAEPLQAAVWGVFLHATAGDKLSRRLGQLGYLARDLLAEIPALMNGLDGSKSS